MPLMKESTNAKQLPSFHHVNKYSVFITWPDFEGGHSDLHVFRGLYHYGYRDSWPIIINICRSCPWCFEISRYILSFLFGIHANLNKLSGACFLKYERSIKLFNIIAATNCLISRNWNESCFHINDARLKLNLMQLWSRFLNCYQCYWR